MGRRCTASLTCGAPLGYRRLGGQHRETSTQCKGAYACGEWLQGSEGSGEGTLALQPDYLLLDSAGRRHVLPARLALTSGQDWWVPRSRVDLCVLTDALHFATQSQLWLLSNSPRPSVCSPDGDSLS